VFDNTTLSFDDNKVLKISIGYANICSSVQDHRQKFKCLYIKQVLEEQTRAIESTKRKLVLQESIWRKERLKRRGFEDHQKHSYQKRITRSWRHQELKVIRSWRLSEAEDWKLKLVKCCNFDCTSLQKE